MTATGIKNAFKKLGVNLDTSTGFIQLEDVVFQFVFSDAMKTKKTDKNTQFKFDFTNEIIVQKRTIKTKNGEKDICYPGTDITCYNVFTFDSLLNIVPIQK